MIGLEGVSHGGRYSGEHLQRDANRGVRRAGHLHGRLRGGSRRRVALLPVYSARASGPYPGPLRQLAAAPSPDPFLPTMEPLGYAASPRPRCGGREGVVRSPCHPDRSELASGTEGSRSGIKPAEIPRLRSFLAPLGMTLGSCSEAGVWHTEKPTTQSVSGNWQVDGARQAGSRDRAPGAHPRRGARRLRRSAGIEGRHRRRCGQRGFPDLEGRHLLPLPGQGCHLHRAAGSVSPG